MQCAAVVATDSCAGQSAQGCIVRLENADGLVSHCRAVCSDIDRKAGVQATVACIVHVLIHDTKLEESQAMLGILISLWLIG
jgi:hypothetical protein